MCKWAHFLAPFFSSGTLYRTANIKLFCSNRDAPLLGIAPVHRQSYSTETYEGRLARGMPEAPGEAGVGSGRSQTQTDPIRPRSRTPAAAAGRRWVGHPPRRESRNRVLRRPSIPCAPTIESSFRRRWWRWVKKERGLAALSHSLALSRATWRAWRRQRPPVATWMATWIQTTGRRGLPLWLRRQPRKKDERRRRVKGLPQVKGVLCFPSHRQGWPNGSAQARREWQGLETWKHGLDWLLGLSVCHGLATGFQYQGEVASRFVLELVGARLGREGCLSFSWGSAGVGRPEPLCCQNSAFT